jgi:catechol 2,3-dioxygenase-like lactoylglutathione lyase family enzyme
MIFGQEINLLKDFYQDHFGFAVVEEVPHQWVVLSEGSMEIALHKVGPGYEREPGMFRAESNTKLIFKIAGDLPAFRQKLISHGVTVHEIKSFDGFPSLFCDGEDPEGNVFHLEQPLPGRINYYPAG